MTKSNSGREKHSYIPFYMDDWQGGTAGMTRPVKSVYFDICLYNWDKVKPMTPAHLGLITSDLGQEMAQGIIEMLIDIGKITYDPDRGYYNERALSIGKQAFDVWSAKSAGGKRGGRGRAGGDDTSSIPNRIPKSMLNDTSSIRLGVPKESDHNQNQNQNHIDNTNVLSVRELEEDEKALQKINEAKAKSAALTEGAKQAVEAWNEMAKVNGLSPVVKMTEARMKHVRARIAEYGVEVVIEQIAKVPNFPFLMGKGPRGWKANFDFIIRPDTVAKIQEGQYHAEQPEQSTGNGFLDAVINEERGSSSKERQ